MNKVSLVSICLIAMMQVTPAHAGPNAGFSYGQFGFKRFAHDNSITYMPEGGVVFQLNCGDVIENGSSRAILGEQPVRTVLGEPGMRYELGVMVPNGWPTDYNVDTLIVQWKNGDGSPYMSLHINHDEFHLKIDGTAVHAVPVDQNRVQHFVFDIVFSETATGSVKMAVNGNVVYEESNIQTMNAGTGITPGIMFGIYKPQWNYGNCDPSYPKNLLLYFPYVQFGPK